MKIRIRLVIPSQMLNLLIWVMMSSGIFITRYLNWRLFAESLFAVIVEGSTLSSRVFQICSFVKTKSSSRCLFHYFILGWTDHECMQMSLLQNHLIIVITNIWRFTGGRISSMILTFLVLQIDMNWYHLLVGESLVKFSRHMIQLLEITWVLNIWNQFEEEKLGGNRNRIVWMFIER